MEKEIKGYKPYYTYQECGMKLFVHDLGDWYAIYNELVCERYYIKIQNWWRSILAKRKFQRLQIQRELIYLPPSENFMGGIEYQKGLIRFNSLLF